MKKIIKKLHLYKIAIILLNVWNYLCKPFNHAIGAFLKEYYNIKKKNLVCIVRIEGGITSQMEQYVLGKMIEKMGYDVEYDLTCYKDGNSYDCLGINPRNFDLQKIDNNIYIKIASEEKVKFFKKYFTMSHKYEDCFNVNSESFPKLPLYLDGYGYGLYSEENFEHVFANSIVINYDEKEFGQENIKMLEIIKNANNSIGMHVRRGDTLMPEVGRPIPKIDYYLKALLNYQSGSDLFIFSDDTNWVKNNLIPEIHNMNCMVVDINGADRGWCDLILMSNCINQIKSPSGGLGRDAYRLNLNENKSIVLPVYVSGNKCNMKGKIFEIIIDESVCDMKYVKDTNIRL